MNTTRPRFPSLHDHNDDSETLLEEEEETFFEMSRFNNAMEQTPLLETVDGSEETVRQKSLDLQERDKDDSGDKGPVLEVIDRIEDEVDYTYEDLVPLEVKLALEDKVFGWSHLSSDIMGHIVFTVGAYTLAFVIISHLQPSSFPLSVFRLIRFSLSFWAGLSAFRMVRRRRRVWLRSGAYGSSQYMKEARRRKEVIREVDRTTLLGRMRQRRNLRKERKHQRKLLKAAERFKSSVQKKRSKSHQMASLSSPRSVSLLTEDSLSLERSDPSLQPEDNESEEEHPNSRVNFHALTTQMTKSIGHDQILFKYGPIRRMPYSHGSFFGAAPFMLANPHWIDVLRLLMPDVYIEISVRVVNAPAPKLIHWAENNPVVAAYGTAHELENTNTIPNLEWDVFLDPHLVHRVEVVLEEQEKFLRSCVPDQSSYRELSGKELRDQVLNSIDTLGLTASQRSILVYYETELLRRTEALVDKMLIAHGNLTQLILEQTGWMKKYNFSRVKRTRQTLGGGMYARQWLAVFAEALKLGKCLDSTDYHEKAASRPLGRVLYSTSSILTRTGSSSSSSDEDESDAPFQCQCLQCTRAPDDVGESEISDCGRLLQRQQSDLPCRNRRPSDSATMELRAPSFSDATPTSSVGRSSTKSSAKCSNDSSPLRQRTDSADAASSPKCLSTSIAESISVIKFITGCKEPLGIVFDIKSRCTSKQVWGLIIDFLRDAGARVEGVASFAVEDIRDISCHASKPVKELVFFHSAGDMQHACHNGRLRQGDTILFNAGSLLWDSRSSDAETLSASALKRCWSSFDAEAVKRSYTLLPYAQYDNNDSTRTSTIKSYKDKFGLSIGLYLQEFAIDEAALNLIVKHANEYSDVYDLGLSWGGVNGITVRGIQPGRFTVTDGFWNQRYAATSWDYSRCAEDAVVAS